MTDERDRQRSKVYAWEERFVAPYDPSTIALAQAQGMVDAIWSDMGLRFPPKVEPLPRHGAKFMGLYVQLLTRYLRLPVDALLTSVHASGIDIDHQATPVFLDTPEPARTSC